MSPFDHPEFKKLTTDEAKINYFLDQLKDLFPDKAQFEVIRAEAHKLYATGCDNAKANGATVENFISFLAEEIAVQLLLADATRQFKAAGLPAAPMAPHSAQCAIKISTTLPQHSNN